MMTRPKLYIQVVESNGKNEAETQGIRKGGH